MKMEILAVFVFFCMACAANAIYLGTCDGYIRNATGVVQGVNVTVTVSGCSIGCTGSTLSASNGYYVVGNLNLPAGGGVSVSATKGSSYNTGTGTADLFQAARVNITLCSAPFPPTLTAQPDIHTTAANLSWTSGTDPANLSTYDRYQLDSNPVINNATTPQYESGLSYASHTWRVQTCNPACCSPWSSDTFVIYNNPPTQPVLTDQTNTLNSSVTLYWTSGTDPDSDPKHDEYQFQSDPIVNPATSPRNETGLTFQSYTWKVRTCDVLGACSNWAIDTFSVINNPCPAPVLTHQPNGHVTNVTLAWTSNATDMDGDPCHDRYQFSSNAVVDPATSPRNETNLSYGVSYTWRVQSCDNKGACSAWQSDTFSTQNNAPSQPNLTDQNHTYESWVQLNWTSGIDAENDTVSDEFQFDSNATVPNATSPQLITNISGIEIHTWRVRTCDSSGACSAWASDTFIRFECPNVTTTTCPPCGGGTPPSCGSGGGGGAVTCKENWTCGSWGACNPYTETQARNCTDLKTCNTTCSKPLTLQHCAYTPTCNDGVRNQGEENIDCGGPCDDCPESPISILPQPECQPAYYLMIAAVTLGVCMWTVIHFVVSRRRRPSLFR